MADGEGHVAAPQVNLSSFNIPIPKFSGKKEDFSIYAERFISSMEANNITDAKRITHTLISTMGDELYKLAHDLFAPVKVSTLKCEDIIKKLTQHLNPPPNIITARCTFNRLTQKPEETINQFVANLRRVAEDCNYGDNLLMWLRDRFVAGVHSEPIRRRLLQEDATMTFDKAYQLSLAMESATKEARSIQQGQASGNVNKMIHKTFNAKTLNSKTSNSTYQNKKRSFKKPPGSQFETFQPMCSRCNATNHRPPNCPYIDAICRHCQKKGHLQRACRARKDSNGNPPPDKGHRATNLVEASELSVDIDLDDDEYSAFEGLFMISSVNHVQSVPKLKRTLLVDSQSIDFEVDTGSSVTLISSDLCSQLFPYRDLSPTSCTLRAYNGQPITVIGKLQVAVSLDGVDQKLPLTIVDSQGPSLLGRDWLQHLTPWGEMFTNHIADPDPADEIVALLEEFQEVFDDSLGHLREFKVSLEMQDNVVPVFCRARSVPLALRKKVEDEIDRLETVGILEKVKFSQWATPVVPIVKRSGEVRLCGDYKATVNRFAKTDIHPIPKVEDLFAELTGGEEFTKLDLRHAYQQLELDNSSKKLTTINTSKGLYQFNRLPYGVSSAPAVFQRTIEMVLKGLKGLVIFMDDICITGRNRQEHQKNLRAVLIALRKAGLKLRRDKCKFFLSKVEFLGYIIDRNGIHPTAGKVKAIQDAPVPQNVGELRSYLGMLNHYSKFLPNSSTKCAPLYDLLKKDAVWKWNDVEQQAFESSKSALTSDSLLVHYDSDKELVLACDASPYGVGCVLQHRTDDGEKPIAYASRKLNSAEKNYSQLEKEGLALIFGVTKFRQYLLGRTFTLVTDHRPLVNIFSPAKETPEMAASRIKRWSLILATFQYTIEYRSSKQNSNADGLSRLPLPCPAGHEDNGELDSELVLLMTTVENDLPVTAKVIALETDKDPELRRVRQLTLEGWPEEMESVNADLKPYFQRRLELSVEQGVVMWGSRVIIPTRFREALLEELHSEHLGMVRMKSVARGIIWWPYLDRDIETLVRCCLDCQEQANHPEAIVPTTWKWPSSPWTRLHIDFAGPFLGYSFLVVVDAHSKWLEVFKLKSTTTAVTIKRMRRLFATFGLPHHVVSDNGSQFTSEEFQLFLQRNNIRHTTTAPAHPATNGQAERAVESFKVAMKKMKNQEGDIEDKLQRFLFSYRTTPHSITGKTPAELLMRRTLRTRLSLLRPALENQPAVREEPPEGRVRLFVVGQPVFVRNYGVHGARWLTGTILECHGDRNYQVSVGHQVWKRHVDQLRPRDSKTLSNMLPEPWLPEMTIPSLAKSAPSFQESKGSTRDTGPVEVPSPPAAAQQSTIHKQPSSVIAPDCTVEPRRNPVRQRQKPARYSD